MDNRGEFLNNVAQALGRPLRLEPQAEDAPLNNYANERLTQLNQQQRCDAFIQFASDVMLTRCELTSEAKAAEAAIRLCKELGDQSVVISGDTRLEELGISERLQQECNAVVWDPAKGAENISQAEQAKVGVVYAEYGLTESGGVVLFSAAERGRSLSLLPEYSLFILRKSTILPRVAQLAEKLHQKAQAGERMPSCINIISGPSSTADIELIKVVGVHGPVKAVYLIIQALDGNLLVPVLFSEAVNLHPLVIILSVVIFGGLWGFWGVFFAIPLATLIKAVIHAWPDGQIAQE